MALRNERKYQTEKVPAGYACRLSSYPIPLNMNKDFKIKCQDMEQISDTDYQRLIPFLVNPSTSILQL